MSLPLFGTADPDTGWLLDNPTIPGMFVLGSLILIGASWKTVKIWADDFMKSNKALALLCIIIGILFYRNLLWLPLALAIVAVGLLRAVPQLRDLGPGKAIAIAVSAYVIGYPLQAIADDLTRASGTGMILLAKPESLLLHSSDADMKQAFNLYGLLRVGLSGSLQRVTHLHIIPDTDPDQKEFSSTYAAVAQQPEQIDRLSRMLAFRGLPLDVIIEADFIDAKTCGGESWLVLIQPQMWRRDAWRAWSVGWKEPAPGWLREDHQLQATKEELRKLGPLAAYELVNYFEQQKVVPISSDEGGLIIANLVEAFRDFALSVQSLRPLPDKLANEIRQATHGDRPRLVTSLKDMVAFFGTPPPASATAGCQDIARKAQATAQSALVRP